MQKVAITTRESDSVFGESFRGFLHHGSRWGSAESRRVSEAHRQSIRKQRLWGDFAIIHSGYRDKQLTGTNGYGRYTDIYERRNGRWLCVAAHFMRFQNPPKAQLIQNGAR
jgi:hypothetical protein